MAISLPEGFIAIDTDKISNSIEEKEIVAHEESHIEAGSFYNFYSPLDIKEKHEHRVGVYTIKKLVPIDEFMANAVKYYKDNNLIN